MTKGAKMKKQLLDKTVLDFPNIRKQEAINRLRALPRYSLCNHHLSNGDQLAFYCSKKGRFMLYKRGKRARLTDYFVRGEVTSCQGDARITIRKYKRNGTLGKTVSAILGSVMIFALVHLFTSFELSLGSILISLAASAIYLIPILAYVTDGDYQRMDAETEYRELISIAKTIRTWDEE